MPAFIESQFPIARLSAESYKERKANNSQTLTRLGKWWGRKPLILVRASILGMLMPASDDAKKDREIFLKILTMDDDGTLARWRRDKRFKIAELGELATPDERDQWNELDGALEQAKDEVKQLRQKSASIDNKDKSAKQTIRDQINDKVHEVEEHAIALKQWIDELQITVFNRLPYADRLRRCERPENVTGPSPKAWAEINAHLSTTASNLNELVEQLGQRTFGHTPRIGDAFCGGGSIPFEAARIGCDAFGSDLNPVATLLTWASLHLLGGGEEVQEVVMQVQEEALKEVDQQVIDWGIEHNEDGERADAYLYCVEVKPEGCDYFIPLAPSWLIGEKSKVVAKWSRVEDSDQLHPDVVTVDNEELKSYKAKKGATVAKSRVIDPFNPDRTWSVESLRGADGLRHWSNEDVAPRPGDVFQERLYCIRWVDDDGNRRYAAPTEKDLQREAKVLNLLKERFASWQDLGFIPEKRIPQNGVETARLYRERGWTHWHHLFTPRQLLTHGLLAEISHQKASSKVVQVGCLLGLGRIANWDSRLCLWMSNASNEGGSHVFNSQALNTFFNYSNRPLSKLETAWPVFKDTAEFIIKQNSLVLPIDARDLRETCDIWLTDPPYADAVNYHELGDFFLAWYDKAIPKIFPEWTPDSRAELAVRGDGEDFRRSMVDIYKNLAQHMPDNGLQMVQFTHQNPAVWADLGMILWAAGLKATAAWTISTETDAVGIKKGNYVQGTVCLVLRKRTSPDPGFLDEVFPLVEDEVRRQIDSMQALDESGEPNFNDADYQLAAYAAALKILTQYASLDGRDVEHEVFAQRGQGETSDFQKVIERAIGIACDNLIPKGLDNLWRDLNLVERYYLRALDIESRGERRKGMYEELARGFGVTNLNPLLKSSKANGTCMHTASGLGKSHLNSPSDNVDSPPDTRDFSSSPLRHLLFAISETVTAENVPTEGLQYLHDAYGPSYWSKREHFIALLTWLEALGNAGEMPHWQPDSAAARILAGRLRSDHS